MMKKIALLIAIVLFAMSLTACSSEATIKYSNVNDIASTYYLFQTLSSDEYLEFLGTFDESSYEIIDISVTQRQYDYTYSITYKNKVETE